MVLFTQHMQVKKKIYREIFTLIQKELESCILRIDMYLIFPKI